MRAYAREYRAQYPHKLILRDCRASDRKRGFLGNDLEVEFVQTLIAEGCRYCGEQDLRISLDRIDNTRPHNKANVVPCCIRCNYLRGSMPYPAWLHIVPSVKEARELGLFGDWRSKPFNRKFDGKSP